MNRNFIIKSAFEFKAELKLLRAEYKIIILR